MLLHNKQNRTMYKYTGFNFRAFGHLAYCKKPFETDARFFEKYQNYDSD